MTWRAVFAFVLVVLIAASIGMAMAAVERSPGWVAHPGAAVILREVWLTLVVYAGVIVVVVANCGEEWDEEMRNAAVFGGIAGAVEAVNVVLENAIPGVMGRPAVSVGAMLVVFALWALAGARTARDLHHFRPGVTAAVMSAGVCMVIAVMVGFAVELFIAPPRPSVIDAWPEFQRSGWMDAQAFGIANTLYSGFTHLWMGPVIGLVVGSLGAGIGARRGSERKAAAAG
jgi:hypothetical protein